MEEVAIENLDIYEIIGVEPSSSEAEIKKAYRKKALQCHPDKNPDKPDAAKTFHQLTRILEILTDIAARSAYDKVLKGRKEAALRHKELDSKRRKLKEDLEAREKYANSINQKKGSVKTPDQLLKEEIERLRKEGSKQVQEEIDLVLQEIRAENNKHCNSWDPVKYRIKIKWNAAKTDQTNGGYTYDILHRFLLKYGDINALVVSTKKKGSALVEFKERRAAEMAVDLEMGLPANPLKLSWINEPPSSHQKSSLVKESDYESVILTKMRQAEERKRIIEQMMAEDNET